MSTTISEDVFGIIPASDQFKSEEKVKRFTLSNGNGMKVQIITYGAAITTISVTDSKGNLKDVILGFDTLEDYLSEKNPYFGATIGRVANRTRDGKFLLNGKSFQLSQNRGSNHLHGGFHGFDKKNWEAQIIGSKVVFSLLSKNGEEGYQGDLIAYAIYELHSDNKIEINYKALSTMSTPICMTNHGHFNLAGHDAADGKLKNHFIELKAEEYTVLDDSLVTTGEIKNVEGTIYDLRTPMELDRLLKSFPEGPNGFDINYCVKRENGAQMDLIATAINLDTKIKLEAYSNQPGVQLYTCNFLPDQDKKETPLIGKGGAKYFKHGAFCLETQNYPNAINNKDFPDAVLNPGDIYDHKVIYKFSVRS